jgi:hypothetical protein
MYPPEVGYLGSHGLCHPGRYMDYATQSSRVGARVPYSMLYILPLRGGLVWLRQLVCPWHLSLDTYVSPPGSRGSYRYSTMLHTILAYRCVLREGVQDLPYPGILWSLLK